MERERDLLLIVIALWDWRASDGERSERDPLAGEIIKLNARRSLYAVQVTLMPLAEQAKGKSDLLPSPRKLHEIIENQIRLSWKFSLTSRRLELMSDSQTGKYLVGSQLKYSEVINGIYFQNSIISSVVSLCNCLSFNYNFVERIIKLFCFPN
jgi:hypothetical protein